MDEVNLVSVAVGRCLDAGCLLLDLVVRTTTSLLRLLSAVGSSLHGALVDLSGSTLVEYWNFAVFSFLTATEAVSSAACGALLAVEGWLQALGGVFETFKMVGHLSCHVAWRVKDLLHRGLVSGGCILRQTCEGVCIALSLVLYFVNTVVNIVLISTQNCLSVLGGVWELVADPLHRVVELALTVLTFLYSCLVGASVLVWTPCQLLLDFLGALGRVFITVFMVDAHGVLITAVVVSLALLFLNPRLPVLARQMSLRLVSFFPGARGVQTIAQPAPANQELHTRTGQEVSRRGLQRSEAVTMETEMLQVSEPSPLDSLQAQHEEPDSGGGMRASPSNLPPAENGGGGLRTDGELLSLLKDQEERKKCVICQDRSKTVLLLPCRHLCLCPPCADILTQRRPVAQRCCPLCRQSITQIMDVFL